MSRFKSGLEQGNCYRFTYPFKLALVISKAGYVFLFEVIRLFLCGMRALVVIRPGAQAASKKYYLIISRCFSS